MAKPKKSHLHEIRLPCYGIIIQLDREHTNHNAGCGTIISDLKGPSTTAAERLYNAAVDGLEALILAHACAGVDVESPAYLEGIETAVEAVASHFA